MRENSKSGQVHSGDTITIDGAVSRQQPLDGGGGEDIAIQKQQPR